MRKKAPKKSRPKGPSRRPKRKKGPKKNIKETKAQIFAWAKKEMQGK